MKTLDLEYGNKHIAEVFMFENGSFNLRQGNDLSIFDNHGRKVWTYPAYEKDGHVTHCDWQFKKIVIHDNCYFTLREYMDQDGRKKVDGLQRLLIREMNQTGCVIHENFTDFHIFDGGYLLNYHGAKHLFNSQNKLVAANFEHCNFFPNKGFALLQNEPTTWKVYSRDGQLIRQHKRVIDIVGNGNAIVCDKEFMLVRADGTELPLPDGQVVKLLNGNFIWVSAKGQQMFDPDGKTTFPTGKKKFYGIEPDEIYLPDGRSISFNNRRVDRLYRRDRLPEKEVVASFEVSGKYYFLTDECDHTKMYDDTGQLIRDDTQYFKALDNFVVVESEKELVLYNQYGEVWSVEK